MHANRQSGAARDRARSCRLPSPHRDRQRTLRIGTNGLACGLVTAMRADSNGVGGRWGVKEIGPKLPLRDNAVGRAVDGHGVLSADFSGDPQQPRQRLLWDAGQPLQVPLAAGELDSPAEF